MHTFTALVASILAFALFAQNSIDTQVSETARIIGIGLILDRLRSISGAVADPAIGLERITAREQASEILSIANLDVDRVIA